MKSIRLAICFWPQSLKRANELNCLERTKRSEQTSKRVRTREHTREGVHCQLMQLNGTAHTSMTITSSTRSIHKNWRRRNYDNLNSPRRKRTKFSSEWSTNKGAHSLRTQVSGKRVVECWIILLLRHNAISQTSKTLSMHALAPLDTSFLVPHDDKRRQTNRQMQRNVQQVNAKKRTKMASNCTHEWNRIDWSVVW